MPGSRSNSVGSSGGGGSRHKNAAAKQPLRRTLVDRQTDETGDAAYHSKRVIREVDAMNTKMNSEKAARAGQVAADTAAIGKIRGEIARIMERYNPIVAHLAEQRRVRGALAEQLRRAHDELAGLSGMSRRRTRRTQARESGLARRAASAHLRATRGYDLRPGTTPNRYGRPMGLSATATASATATHASASGMAHTMRSRGGGGGSRSGSRSMLGSMGSSMGSTRGTGGMGSRTRGGRPQTSKV